MSNQNKYPLSEQELNYFETNEIACMKALKEGKLYQKDGSWFKTTSKTLIPEDMEKEKSSSNDEVIKNFDVPGFIREYEDYLTQDDLADLLGYNLLDDSSMFSIGLKRQAYERAMAIKQRVDND